MITNSILKAIITKWKSDINLLNIPIYSTKAPPNTQLPYAIIDIDHINTEFSSASYQLGNYKIKIHTYGAENRTIQGILVDNISALMDFHIEFDVNDGCYMLLNLPDYEHTKTDVESWYGKDINVSKSEWNLKLSETRF